MNQAISNPTNNTNPIISSTNEKINEVPVSKIPIENEVNSLQNDTSDNLLIQGNIDTNLPANNDRLIDGKPLIGNDITKPTNLEDKLADLETALQAFTPLDDALAAFGITNEEFNCYLDTLGTNAETYLKQQYGLGLVSFRSNLAILAATKPTAAKLLYDDLVNRGLVGNHDATNNNIIIKFEGDD